MFNSGATMQRYKSSRFFNSLQLLRELLDVFITFIIDTFDKGKERDALHVLRGRCVLLTVDGLCQKTVHYL